MKVDHERHVIELSRRNLRALITKLDGHPENSACTIFYDGWSVKAVEDDKHYGNRAPGPMVPATEKKLRDDVNPDQLMLPGIN